MSKASSQYGAAHMQGQVDVHVSNTPTDDLSTTSQRNSGRDTQRIPTAQAAPTGTAGATAVRKDVYTYACPWPLYGLDWCKRPDHGAYRLAVGSLFLKTEQTR